MCTKNHRSEFTIESLATLSIALDADQTAVGKTIFYKQTVLNRNYVRSCAGRRRVGILGIDSFVCRQRQQVGPCEFEFDSFPIRFQRIVLFDVIENDLFVCCDELLGFLVVFRYRQTHLFAKIIEIDFYAAGNVVLFYVQPDVRFTSGMC